MDLVDLQTIEELPTPLEERTLWECLLHAIDAIPDPIERNVMLDAATGVTIFESSIRLGLSPARVYRLRQQGICLLRVLLADRLPRNS
jgi:hypothetical protein